jgi:NADPH:quinone reductase-like Zn-dependent oxidoreductase
MITTEAWVLHAGRSRESGLGELSNERYCFPDTGEDEVLAEPLFGCWEANMTHALRRRPVDICRLRREKSVVLGNAGVVRVLQIGPSVTTVKEGDLCIIVPIGRLDQYGYMMSVLGYDEPNTIGLLAKRIKLKEKQILLLPKNTKHPLQQWAAFSVRYATAWDNWRVANGCFRLQVSDKECPAPHVWGWGGGVALAELALAKTFGCHTAMISSNDERLELIRKMGIKPIDRRQFMGIDYDEQLYESDRKYKARYLALEKQFLAIVQEETCGSGVSIFIDNIGTPVLRATLRALGRQGVITTAGWDQGDCMRFSRITECISRHNHIHTHGARYSESPAAIRFAEENGWMPPVEETVYSWETIPRLAEDFAQARITSYFPLFQVNSV